MPLSSIWLLCYHLKLKYHHFLSCGISYFDCDVLTYNAKKIFSQFYCLTNHLSLMGNLLAFLKVENQNLNPKRIRLLSSHIVNQRRNCISTSNAVSKSMKMFSQMHPESNKQIMISRRVALCGEMPCFQNKQFSPVLPRNSFLLKLFPRSHGNACI